MSKKQQIVDLLSNTDLSNKEIAARVGCHGSYVRVVQQRLAAGGRTNADEAWLERRLRRYHTDEAYREEIKGKSLAHYYKKKALEVSA